MDTSRSHFRNCLAAVCMIAISLATFACGPSSSKPVTPDAGNQADTDNASSLSKKEAATRTNRGKADWSGDICERNGWYGDQACDWFCPEDDPDCNLDPLGPEPQGEPARYPIVLHHGFMGSDTNFWSFHRVADALREDGHEVYESEVPPFHSVETRAESLADQVDTVLENHGAKRVNIVAHSMGGLDARYLISSLDYADRVASLTTISSPHGGTRIADAFLELVPDEADAALDAFARMAGGTFSDVADRADLRAAMEDLATENSEAFDEANPNAEGVYYQSWAGVSSPAGVRLDGLDQACDGKLLMHEGTMDHMSSLLWPAAAITGGGTALELNDGMATIESAKWGEFRGCIPADHLDEVGQRDDDGMNEHTGFDHVRFYRNLAFRLADRGF